MRISQPSSLNEKAALTRREAGVLLGLCERSVFNLTKTGQLRVVRFGKAVRIARSEIDRILAEKMQASSAA